MRRGITNLFAFLLIRAFLAALHRVGDTTLFYFFCGNTRLPHRKPQNERTCVLHTGGICSHLVCSGYRRESHRCSHGNYCPARTDNDGEGPHTLKTSNKKIQLNLEKYLDVAETDLALRCACGRYALLIRERTDCFAVRCKWRGRRRDSSRAARG